MNFDDYFDYSSCALACCPIFTNDRSEIVIQRMVCDEDPTPLYVLRSADLLNWL